MFAEARLVFTEDGPPQNNQVEIVKADCCIVLPAVNGVVGEASPIILITIANHAIGN